MDKPMTIRPLNHYDLFKVLALLAAIIDHVGLFFHPEIPELRVIGRLAMPLFAMLIGCAEHQPIKPALWVSALFMSILMSWLYQEPTLNILVGLIAAKWLVSKTHEWRWTERMVVGVICLVAITYPLTIWMEYSLFPSAFALLAMAVTRHKMTKLWLYFMLTVFLVLQAFMFGFWHHAFDEILLLAVLAILVWFVQMSDRLLQPWHVPFFGGFCQFLSRHALAMYVGHFVFFTLLAAVVSR